MEKQFNECGLKVKRIKACVVPPPIILNQETTQNELELCCLCSHLKTIYQAYQDGVKECIILEDSTYIKYLIDQHLLANYLLNNLPKDFECVNLCVLNPLILDDLQKEFKNGNLSREWDDHDYGCKMYYINRKGIEKIVENFPVVDGKLVVEDKFQTYENKPQHTSDYLIYKTLNSYSSTVHFGNRLLFESTLHKKWDDNQFKCSLMINDFYQSHENFKMPNYNLINKVRDKKIFFMCTHPNQGTGYARVANKLTNFLVKRFEVTYFAFQNFPNQDVKDRFIDPKIKIIDAVKEDSISPKGFGDNAIIPSFENEKPDILFLYNDLPMCVSILKLLENCNHKKYKVILYLDLVYKWEDIERIEYLKTKTDFCFVFLKCWKDHLVTDYLWNPQKIAVLPHGIDTNDFKKLDSKKSKKELGFQEDDFIVLNMNRNSYRKQWYLTIQAFIIFLIKTNLNPRVKLFCSCLLFTDDGFDIKKLILTECLKYNLDSQKILDNHIFHNPTALFSSEEKVNLIYNTCDVGINTCCGEGFGLTNLEHGILGKPQIVSGVPALKETLGKHGIIVEPKIKMTVSNFESHGGEICIFKPEHFAEQLFNIFKFYTESTNLKTHIENKYNWENVYKTLDFVMTIYS